MNPAFTLPTAVTAPVTAVLWLVVLVRMIGFRSTLAARRMNVAAVFGALACTLRIPVLQDVLRGATGVSRVLVFQLSEVAILFASTALYLLVAAMLHRPGTKPVPAWAIYCVATAFGAAMLAFGTQARERGLIIEETTGWSGVGYVASFCVLSGWCDLAIVAMSVSELVRGHLRRVEIGVQLAICGLFVWSLMADAVVLVAAVRVALGHPVHEYGGRNHILYTAGVGIAIATLPVVSRGLELVRWDSWSRRRNQLLPLWSDLTAACPEVVLQTPGLAHSHRSRYRLHRSIVEIRDCILILSRYATPNPPEIADELDPKLALAVQLARACAAKTRGDEPTGDIVTQRSIARNLLDETEELAGLACVWPRAKDMMRRYAESLSD